MGQLVPLRPEELDDVRAEARAQRPWWGSTYEPFYLSSETVLPIE
jgi:hypothetical protein